MGQTGRLGPDRSWVISKLKVEEECGRGGQGVPHLYFRGDLGQLTEALSGPQYSLWENQRWESGSLWCLRTCWAAPG